MGIPIRGGAETVETVIAGYRIEELILSTAAIDPERERQVREACARKQVPVRRFKLEITE
jgi:FlaA1/EpsC-like NDP-sugar epimerase